MSIPVYDIAIVGAGPAGCATALALKSSGLRVLLIDKKTFPRDKTCGDAIPGPAIKTLQKVLEGTGEDFSRFDLKQQISTADIYTVAKRKISIQWKLEACNSMRLHFDDYLLGLVKKYTDVEVREGAGIRHFQRANLWHIEDESGNLFSARLLIGCDGAHSLIRKSVLPKNITKPQQGVALRQYYKGVVTASDCNEFFLFTEGGGGYFWIFPVGNGIFNTGIGISAQADEKADLKTLFKTLVQQHPLIATRMKDAILVDELVGYRLPYGGRINFPVSGNGFMLAGDAAYLVDPLQGHGIHTAMQSGVMAAEQAINCFNAAAFSANFMQQYDNQVLQKIGKVLKRNDALLRYLYRQQWIVEGAAIAAKSRFVQRIVQKVF